MRAAPCVCGLLVGLSIAASVSAGTVYNSGGFDSPRFTPGTLTRQENGLLAQGRGAGSAIAPNIPALAADMNAPDVQRNAVIDHYTVTTINTGHGRHGIPLPAAVWPGLMMLVIGMILLRVRRVRRA
jgi:hypothetical protein